MTPGIGLALLAMVMFGAGDQNHCSG